MQYRFLTVLLILPLVLPSALPAADAYSAAAPSPDLKAKSLGMDHRPARPPDEVDELIERLRPPARFSGYQPNFRVTQRTFTFQHVSGPIEKTWNVVMDGPRYVALVRSGDFNLLALTPDQAETKLIMPQGRYHLDTQQGPTLCTHQFLRGVKVHGAIYEDRFAKPNDQWEGGGRTITLVRSATGEDRVVSHRFTVAVDPVLGYTITGRYEVRFSSPPTPEDHFVGPTFCPGCYTLWPETQIYERTVYCAGAGQARYRGRGEDGL